MLVREQEVSNRSNMGLDILSKMGIHVGGKSVYTGVYCETTVYIQSQ